MGSTPPQDRRTDSDRRIAFDRLIDWVIGIALGIIGFVAGLGGWGLYSISDRSEIATLIHNSEFQSEVLTEAEVIDALAILSDWVGIGLIVTGGILFTLGLAVVIAHHRARSRGRITPRWIVSVVGAIVGLVLAFIPFSPTIGGAVAGYLDPEYRSSGAAAGALSGIFGTLPALIIGAFGSFGLIRGLPDDVAVPVVVVIAIALLIIAVYQIALGAIGGYVGNWIRE